MVTISSRQPRVAAGGIYEQAVVKRVRIESRNHSKHLFGVVVLDAPHIVIRYDPSHWRSVDGY